MKLIEIAAIGQNRELGQGNAMIWHLPADLKFFRQQTQGHAIVMGRKTFESLPKKLPGRHHIVISSTMPASEDVEVFESLDAFFDAYKHHDQTVYVIGGGMLYGELLPYCDELVLTHVEAADPQAEVFFPAFDLDDFVVEPIDEGVDGGLATRHVRYIRKK